MPENKGITNIATKKSTIKMIVNLAASFGLLLLAKFATEITPYINTTAKAIAGNDFTKFTQMTVEGLT